MYNEHTLRLFCRHSTKIFLDFFKAMILQLLRRNRQRPWAHYFIASAVISGALLLALMISNMGLKSTWNHLQNIASPIFSKSAVDGTAPTTQMVMPQNS